MRFLRRTRSSRLGLLIVSGLIAGCSGSHAVAHHGTPGPVAPAVLPVSGGMLRIVAGAPVAWTEADGVPSTAGAALARLTGRQLVSLDGVDSLGDRADPIFDLTTFADPSDDKLTVTARLRSVRYAPPFSGTLRAADFVFGLELLCNPAHPDADSALLSGVLVGYAAFCSGMRQLPEGEAGVKAYADSHPIDGLSVTANDTLILRLIKPQGDLLDILSLPDMTPFPESTFSPSTGVDTWVQAPALGPYIRTPTGNGFSFARNPAWDATQDPLRRAWVDGLTLTTATSLAGARAEVDSGAADVMLDDALTPGASLTLPVVPGSGSDPASVLRTTPAGDLLALVPLRSAPGACAEALNKQEVRQALVVGLDHRPVAGALGGSLLADARSWPLPTAFVGGGGAPPVVGRAVGADGPGTVPAPVAGLGDTPGLGGDPGRARVLLAGVGVTSLACSLTATDATTGAPDPRLLALLPAVAAGLKAIGIKVRIRNSGPADLTVVRLSSAWRGDGASNLLGPLLTETTDSELRTAVARAEAQADPNLAATRWGAVATLLLNDGDLVPLAEERLQSLTSKSVRGFRWYGLGDGVDLANAAVADG